MKKMMTTALSVDIWVITLWSEWGFLKNEEKVGGRIQ